MSCCAVVSGGFAASRGSCGVEVDLYILREFSRSAEEDKACVQRAMEGAHSKRPLAALNGRVRLVISERTAGSSQSTIPHADGRRYPVDADSYPTQVQVYAVGF